MKNFSQLFLLVLLALSTFTACHKHEDDSDNPVLTITSPTESASISGAVSITGLVTDESLHEMSIIVTKDSDGSELYNNAPEVHDLTSYTIAQTWTPTGISAETAVTLTVTVEDHSANVVSNVVKFKVKP